MHSRAMISQTLNTFDEVPDIRCHDFIMIFMIITTTPHLRSATGVFGLLTGALRAALFAIRLPHE